MKTAILNPTSIYRKTAKYFSLLLLLLFSFAACKEKGSSSSQPLATKKLGVLLVNHGSHSETWRQALLDLETSVKDSVLANGNIKGIKTAFMEYTEPSIATRLKEFDKEEYTDVIVVPIFLTVSPHSFDDLPTIVGLKENPESMEMLKLEKIERYTPKAKVHITEMFDFTDILEKNVLKRFMSLSQNPANEGLVMIAYGDKTYVKEWSDLLTKTGQYVRKHASISAFSFGWCGHIAHYNPDSTTTAINAVLNQNKNAVVIPVLVAVDEMFQVKIIGDGIAKTGDRKKLVHYKPDAILPDKNIEEWVLQTIFSHTNKILNNTQPSAL